MVRTGRGLKPIEKAGASARKQARGKVKKGPDIDEGTQEKRRKEAGRRGAPKKKSAAVNPGDTINDSLDLIMDEQRRRGSKKKPRDRDIRDKPTAVSRIFQERATAREEQSGKKRKQHEEESGTDAEETNRAKRHKARLLKPIGKGDATISENQGREAMKRELGTATRSAQEIQEREAVKGGKGENGLENKVKVKKDKTVQDIVDEEDKKAGGKVGEGGVGGIVRVNRAPVLTLWVAVVAQREGMSFEEGLTFGRAIAGLYAHAKGKRLGLYEEADEETKEERRKRREQFERVEVFGTRIPGLRMPAGQRVAVQDGKPVNPGRVEAYLRKAFGQHFEGVKDSLQVLANAYSPDKIGAEAYTLYEQFRPIIPEGVRGWGAKGVLDLNLVSQLAQEA